MLLGDKITGGSSAYTKVGFELCRRLVWLGHNVAHVPMGRVNFMGKHSFGGVLVYPSGADYFCEDVIVDHYIDFKTDMLITLKEPWAFNNMFTYGINWVPHAIIDHSPVSQSMTQRLTTAFKVIAPSRHAQIELKRKNIESEYIPHGIPWDVYKPLPDKKACRDLFYIPQDEFIVGVVAMNRSRKMIPRMLRGFKRFTELNPDVKTKMFLWTNVQPRRLPEDVATSGIADVGVHLVPEIVELELWEKTIHPRWDEIEKMGGIPEWDAMGGWDMVKLLNCFDVLMNCTGGEGYSLIQVEAQSCGVPVMTTHYAAGPEQVGAGEIVRASDYVNIITPGTRYMLADIDKMAESLTRLYNADREKMAKKARSWAKQRDWPNVIHKYWVPFLDSCALELKPKITGGKVGSWS